MNKYEQYTKNIKMNLPIEIDTLLNILYERGFESFVVGGAVRDLFLGKTTPYDYDITSNASPSEMTEIFSDYKVIPTGLKHGTVTILAKPFSVEATTYRVDGDYVDHRRPETVCFSANLIDDLARRDFTMNAMAFNPRYGIVDPFCGADDIRKELIKCVGDPLCRFEEDSLRIMRGLRFASSLGFEIDEKTAAAMKEKSILLPKISKERLQRELSGVLNGRFSVAVLTEFSDIFSLLYELGALKPRSRTPNFAPLSIFCDSFYRRLVSNAEGSVDIEKYRNILNAAKETFTPPLLKGGTTFENITEGVKLRMLLDAFSERGDNDNLRNFLTIYKYDNKTIKLVSSISLASVNVPSKCSLKTSLCENGEVLTIGSLMYFFYLAGANLFAVRNSGTSKKNANERRSERKSGEQNFDERAADERAIERETEPKKTFREAAESFYLLREIFLRGECYTLAQLAVGGQDLKQISSLKPLKYGETLNFLLSAVIRGDVANEKESLLTYLNSELNKK